MHPTIRFFLVGEERLDKNDPSNNDRWTVARSEADARKLAAEKLGVPEEAVELEQDEDVLDTWFRSVHATVW